MINIFRRIFEVDENSFCLVVTNDTCIQVYDCDNCVSAEQRSYIKTKQDEPVHFTLHNPEAKRYLLCRS